MYPGLPASSTTTASETGVDEAADYYSMVGLGVDAQRIRYS
jgi:hypothetical protein